MSSRFGLVAFLALAVPAIARADPATVTRAVPSGEGAAPSATLPAPTPCEPPEAEGSVRVSTGCCVFGLRESLVEVRGVRAGEGPGVMLSSEGQEYVRRGLFSGRGLHRLAIGGGGAGFEGALLGGLAGGVRAPLGERHGIVVRAGVEGYLLGNDAFYSSLLELPQIQLGYQYMRGITVYELGAKNGAVLAGRWRAGEGDARRLGDGFELGGYATMQVPWLRLSVSATRLPTRDVLSSAIDVAEGTLCLLAAPIGACLDARLMQGRVLFAGAPSDASVAYVGLTLGFTRER
jgi:hypothetical protein